MFVEPNVVLRKKLVSVRLPYRGPSHNYFLSELGNVFIVAPYVCVSRAPCSSSSRRSNYIVDFLSVEEVGGSISAQGQLLD